jgi:HAD superfamily phosphoserine phosphatase-like hydrolase
MTDYLFLFDLDSTITQQEVVPVISSLVGPEAAEEMQRITEATMRGEIPFRQSLIDRVNLLRHVDVERVNEKLKDMPLNQGLVAFLHRHKERCYIVTGNLDVWIRDLIRRMDMEGQVFCSKTQVKGGQIQQLVSIVDKGLVAQQIAAPFVAVGDGSNDAPMCALANIGVGFGGVRPIASPLAAVVDYSFQDEHSLVDFLESIC